jgi:hypothetical protein
MTMKDILADQTQVVKDIPTARSYLAKAEFIPASVDITISQLINTLVLLSADKSISKQASNIIWAVAILLQSSDLTTQTMLVVNVVSKQIESFLQVNVVSSSSLQGMAAKIKKRVIFSLEMHLKEGLEGIQKKQA